jgi:hypothetical protein
MNSPLLGVLIVIVLIVGSTLTIMNKACKHGYHSWCAPISTVRAPSSASSLEMKLIEGHAIQDE